MIYDEDAIIGIVMIALIKYHNILYMCTYYITIIT